VPANYKTVLCNWYEKNGQCRYGDKCRFAHGQKELRFNRPSYNNNSGEAKNPQGNTNG